MSFADRFKKNSKEQMLERELKDLHLKLYNAQKDLMLGSMTLDYVAVRSLKDKIESARKEINSVQRKLDKIKS